MVWGHGIFNLVVRSDNSILLTARYADILGSRWLSDCIDVETLPDSVRLHPTLFVRQDPAGGVQA